MSVEKYPKYEECKKCNYYEDDGLYSDPNSCLHTCKIHGKKQRRLLRRLKRYGKKIYFANAMYNKFEETAHNSSASFWFLEMWTYFMDKGIAKGIKGLKGLREGISVK